MNIKQNKRKSNDLSQFKHVIKKIKINNNSDNSDDYDDSDNEEKKDDPLKLLKILEDTSIFIKNNHIYFKSPVSEKSIAKLMDIINSANEAFEELKNTIKIAKLEPTPLYLHITSNGGNLFFGLLGYDIIKNSKIPIYTIVEGYANSAASLMSVAGKKRFITENSFLLLHELRTTIEGTYSQLTNHNVNNEMLMNKCINIYLSNSKMKKKELNNLLKRDLYLNSEVTIKTGLVDEIYKGQ
jgi:ATP-dependent protease ClpP protease subunit